MRRRTLPLIACLLAVLLLVTFSGCRRDSAGTGSVSPETIPEQTEVPEPSPAETEPEPPKPVETCVLLGDSITAQGDFAPYFPSVTLYNLGISGDTIVGVTERLGQAAQIAPDLMLILCGINSLSDETLDGSLAEYESLLSDAAAMREDTRIVIQSVLPADETYMNWKSCSDETIRAFNDGIRAMAEGYGFDYLDLYASFAVNNAMDPALTTDGLHLNKAGYDIWAELIRPYIEVRYEEDSH